MYRNLSGHTYEGVAFGDVCDTFTSRFLCLIALQIPVAQDTVSTKVMNMLQGLHASVSCMAGPDRFLKLELEESAARDSRAVTLSRFHTGHSAPIV